MKIDNTKLQHQIILHSVISGVAVLSTFIYLLYSIIKVITNGDLVNNLIKLLSAIMFFTLFVWLSLMLRKILVQEKKKLNFEIKITSGYVILCLENKEISISIRDVMAVLSSNRQILFVWRIGHDNIRTFSLRMEYFKKTDWDNLIEQLSQLKCFYDDEKKVRRFKKENKLDHIFRKNKLEYEL
jgi:hypothetical protein